VANLRMTDVEISHDGSEARPPMLLDDVHNAVFENLTARRESGPCFVLRNVSGLEIRNCPSLPDTSVEEAREREL